MSKILPVLTVICTFVAVGLILTSVLSKSRGENALGGDRTDASPGAVMTEPDPPAAGTEHTAGDDTQSGENTATETLPRETETETETETEPPVQTVPVGIYTESKRKCTRVTEYFGVFPESDDDPLWKLDTWTYKDHANLICDLETFAVFTATDDTIKVSSWDKTWVEKWESCGLDDGDKIGFEFTIKKKDGGRVRFTVLSPADTFKHEEYFELYLYDCVAHAHDSWYSHITEKTNYPDTKNVMVKITLRNGCYDIDEIELKAFVYGGEDEFDSNGFYRGGNFEICVIKRKQ